MDFKEPARSHGRNLVRVTGFEPVTLRLSSACSDQLSYTRIDATGGAEETRTPDL